MFFKKQELFYGNSIFHETLSELTLDVNFTRLNHKIFCFSVLSLMTNTHWFLNRPFYWRMRMGNVCCPDQMRQLDIRYPMLLNLL